jgi:hypothetical protein
MCFPLCRRQQRRITTFICRPSVRGLASFAWSLPVAGNIHGDTLSRWIFPLFAALRRTSPSHPWCVVPCFSHSRAVFAWSTFCGSNGKISQQKRRS